MNFAISDEEKMNSRAFYVAFASSFDLESREYLLFDFARITAAVGGAMGLFLGVSLFQVRFQNFLCYCQK